MIGILWDVLGVPIACVALWLWVFHLLAYGSSG